MIEVDDPQGALKLKRTKKRQTLIWLAAVMLIGLMVGLMAGRLVNPLPAPDDHRLSWRMVEQATGFDLLIRAAGDVSFNRLEHDGAISYRFNGVSLESSSSNGVHSVAGQSLGWRFENREQAVQLLLLSLSTPIEVRHSPLPQVAGRSGIKLEVRLR